MTVFLPPLWPRVVYDPGLGRVSRTFINAFTTYLWPNTLFMPFLQVTTVVGRTYDYVQGNSDELSTDRSFTPIPGGAWSPGGVSIAVGNFVATQTTYWLWAFPGGSAAPGDPVTARVLLFG